ncbi:MAG: hypothetical protein R3D66_07315 [Alphaproteobacteria bacterium]
MPVTQFNMKYVEQAGLVKFDFLGLKTGDSRTKDTGYDHMWVARKSTAQIPLMTRKRMSYMASGNTVGVFQLVRRYARTRCARSSFQLLEDIIALVSLYRPGPMDNIPRYIAVKEEREDADYMHPILKPLLEDTYGTAIYQEQVMQAAQELAFTIRSAVRICSGRAMGKRSRRRWMRSARCSSTARKHHDVLVTRPRIFEQINKFAGYGF